jgi:hypothetical protein
VYEPGPQGAPDDRGHHCSGKKKHHVEVGRDAAQVAEEGRIQNAVPVTRTGR